MRVKSWFLLALLLVSFGTYAHSLNVARFELQSIEERDYLIINFTYHALEETVISELNVENYFDREKVKELKSLTINYLKPGIHIKVNGESLILGAGMIKLGHSSLVQLEIENLPDEVLTMEAGITCFQEIEHQQNLFVFQSGDLHIREVLTHEDDFTMHYGDMEDAQSQHITSSRCLAGIVVLIFMLVIWKSATKRLLMTS